MFTVPTLSSLYTIAELNQRLILQCSNSDIVRKHRNIVLAISLRIQVL